MPEKYAWRFPDGEVIPFEDELAIYTKLRASDDFVNRISDDEYYRGDWYRNEYNSELESIIEDPDYLLDQSRTGLGTTDSHPGSSRTLSTARSNT